VFQGKISSNQVLLKKATVLSKATPSLLEKALALQSAGETDAAQNLFEQVLKSDGKNAVALYSMAVMASARKDFEDALKFIKPVTLSHPNFAQAHLAKSVILFNLGQFDEALNAAEKAIHLEPSLPNAQAHLETVKVAKGMLQAKGQRHETLNTEVNALTQQAIAHQGQGQHNEAIALLNQALAIEPNFFSALYSLGISLGATGQKMTALDCFIKAADVAPHLPIGHFAKAQSYAELGLADDALANFDKTIEVDPTYTQAYTNKAALLQGINRHHDALLTLIACVEVDPNNALAYEGQGHLLSQFKQFDLSVNAFKRVLEIDPNYSYAEGHLMHARLSCCDWTDYEESRQRIFDGIRAGKKVCGPMTIMAITDDAGLARQCIEIYAQDKYGEPLFKLWNGEKYAHRKKRVAFISADFRVHPVGYLLIELIETFDKEKFELIGVFTGTADGSDLWKRYRCAFDHYVNGKDMPSYELANLLRSMEIDIAIDLSGHTEGTKLGVLSYRPAPIQMTYLGFPGTLALPFIDYLIADQHTVPYELQNNYLEKLVYLPNCYLPRDNSVLPSENIQKRIDYGLPDNAFIFCCFNHDYKISPKIFEIWMEILNQVDGSVLWLMETNHISTVNLKKEARKYGINPSRIIFAKRIKNIEDHLARYSIADLFIDTYPYNGHTTASDAIRGGLPVLSIHGSTFASRVAYSLLKEIDLGKLNFSSSNEYQKKAIELALNPSIIKNYKNIILNNIAKKEWPKDIRKGFENLLLNFSN
jgi:protein O-GlcNAc transferase